MSMTSVSEIGGSGLHGRSLRQRFMRNVTHLAGGKAVSAGLGFVSLALMARVLGPSGLGIVAIIESYCRLIDQVLRVETWQAVIRYGTQSLVDEDRRGLARLIKLCIVIDATGAVVVATVASVAVPIAAGLFEWNNEAQVLARLYAISLLFGVSSTPVGVLRLFGRFAQMAWIDPALAIARVVGLAIILLLGGGLRSVVFLLVGLVIAERVAMMCLATRAIRSAGHIDVVGATIRGWRSEFPQIATFLLATNGAVLLRKATQESDTLMVGYLIGSAGAGIYQFARRAMQTVAKTAQLLQQLIAPDLARLWAEGAFDRFARIVRRIELATFAGMAVAIGALIVSGPTLIRLIGGSGFASAYLPMIAYAVAVALFLGGTTMRSALTVSGHAAAVLSASLVATLAYLAVLIPSIHVLGVTGASAAQIVFSATALLLTARAYQRDVKHHHSTRTAS